MQGPLRAALPSLLLAAILVLAGGLKLVHDPPPVLPGEWDSNLYLQIAQHVAAGEGLLTSASVYYRGYRELPHGTVVYPLWPLVLGKTGAVIGLEAGARLLPELLYLLSLLMLYPVANAIGRGAGGGVDPMQTLASWLRTGHVAVLILALNPIYFHFTSLPYTEALGQCLVLAALLAVHRATRPAARTFLAWGAAAGALAGLAFLTRTQLLGAMLVVPGALFLVRGRGPLGALVAGLCSTIVVLPWALYLAGFVEPFSPGALVFGSYRETLELLPPQKLAATEGVLDFVWDRLGGLRVAFEPFGRNSYVRSFGPAVYLLPLALVGLVLRRRSVVRAAADRTPDTTLVLASVGIGVLSLAPTHLVHWTRPFEWFFHWRHGLPVFLLIVPAFAFLAARGRIVRATALTLVAASVAYEAREVTRLVRQPVALEIPTSHRSLAHWIDAQGPGAVMLTTQARYLATLSHGGFHHIECDASPEQTRLMLAHLPIDYVIVFPRDARCGFLRGLPDPRRPLHVIPTGARPIRLFPGSRSARDLAPPPE